MTTIFQNRKIITKPSFQVLPNNILDKEVQRIVYSFNFAFSLFFSSKFHVRDNHIYPNGKKYYLLSFCYLLVVNSLSIYRMFHMDYIRLNLNKDNLGNSFAVFLTFLFFTSYVIGFTIMFILDIVHKHNYMSFILKIQTIHTSIDVSKSIQSYIIWNWILLIILCDSFISSVHYFLSFDISYFVQFIPELICDLIFVTLDVNLLVAIRIIILLRKYLDAWINEVLTMNDEQENDEQCHKLLEIHQHILKAYDLYKSVFQVLVLFQILQAFFRTIAMLDLVFYEYALSKLSESEQKMIPVSKIEVSLVGLMTAVYIVRNTIFVIIQSVYCEKFYITVEDADTACIQLMKNWNCPKSQKHLCMNVIMANRTFNRMTACGLFYVDVTLARSLMGIIINYVVVLLQFFFL